MKKYTVIKYFTDLQDSGFAYHEGDIFPREGLKVSKERLEELSTSANRRKQPLIKEVIEEPKEEPVEAVVEDIPEENAEEPKEEPKEVKAGSSTSKSTKAKKSTKKG